MSQRSKPDDLEQLLEEILEEEENAAPVSAKKRRLMPGTDTHIRRFQNLFARSHTVLSDTLDTFIKDICSLPNSILHLTNAMLRQLQTNFPGISDEIRQLILAAAHLVEGKISDKPMLADAAASGAPAALLATAGAGGGWVYVRLRWGCLGQCLPHWRRHTWAWPYHCRLLEPPP